MANVIGNAWLDQMEAKWADQMKRASTGGFANKPDGLYDVDLVSVELTQSKKGDPQVNWLWAIVGGDLEGQQQMDFDGLAREDAFYWLGMKLARFGFDPTELAAAGPRALLEVITIIDKAKPKAQLKLKTNKGKDGNDYQNVYLNKVYEDDNAAPEELSDPFSEPAQQLAIDANKARQSATTEDTKVSPPEDVPEKVSGLHVGMQVHFNMKGVKVVGHITALDNDDAFADIKVGNTTRQVPFNQLEVIAEPALA